MIFRAFPYVALLVFSVTSSGVAVARSPLISIDLVESSQPSEWSVQVFGAWGNYLNIVAPNGQVHEPRQQFSGLSDRFLPAGLIRFEETFDSHDSALSFLHGAWSATEVTSLRVEDAEMITHQFSVDPFTIDDLNRALPVVSSPAPGFEAQNGEPFLLAWDFEMISAEDESPNQSVIYRQRTDPEEFGFSKAVVGASSSVGGWSQAGGHDFRSRLAHEEGDNRVQFTASSNESLPQTFEIRLGSYFPLDEFLDIPSEKAADPSSRPLAGLTYSRFADTLNIALSGREFSPTCFVPHGILGDFDSNGTVEFDDFLTLADNFGSEVSTYAEGDADCNGLVLFSDFLALSENFGRSAAATSTSQVPEPSTFALALGCVGMLILRRR